VNAENTENEGVSGWIFYDAACPICRTASRMLEDIFARRGFKWVPLQTPGTAGHLGFPEAALLEEMKLLLPDHRVLGGIESWIRLFRSVWWLWPLGTLLSLPGCNALGRVSYRWLARHRYRLAGKCPASPQKRHRRTIPFMDLP
jgi:predicted DCC family thiol-disulfide oxidoreductase YuxK